MSGWGKPALVAALCAASLACTSESPDARGEVTSEAIAGASAPDLSGHYRITRLADGTELGFPLEVSANATAIWWEPSCSGQGLAYRASGEQVEFYDPRKPGEVYPVCDIGFPEELTQLWAELAGTREVSLGEDRVLRVSDGTRQWVFEPTTDPLPPDLSGRWRLEEMNGGAGADMHLNEFTADGSRIWWEPLCADRVASYAMDGDRFRVTRPAYTPPDPADAPLVVPREVCAVGVPEEVDEAFDAMARATKVSRDNRNNIVIAGPERYVVLRRLP